MKYTFSVLLLLSVCFPECWSSEDCPHDLWPPSECIPASGECSLENVPGFCVEVDMDCDFDWSPICGCDGLSYFNSCISQSWYNVGTLHSGTCDDRSLLFVSSMASWEIVDGSPDYPFPSIQLAINAADNGDTVIVSPGTYYENLNVDSLSIVLGSFFLTTNDTSYISQTIIDGSSSGSVINISESSEIPLVISGLTICNGLSEDGGGVYSSHSTIALNNLVISNNIATQNGGGIYIVASDIDASDLLISENTAHAGGGLFASSWWQSNFFGTRVTIQNNHATDGGGACVFGNLDLYQSEFYGNEATEYGGAIYLSTTADFNFNRVVLSNNSCGITGSAGKLGFCTPSFINCTISDNFGTNGNPAVFYGEGCTYISMTNSIMAGNQANSTFSFHPWSYPNSLAISYSLIEGGIGSIQTNNNVELNWLEGNVDEDPLFVDSENHDYHLLEGSICIDSGDPDLDSDGLSWLYDPDDQDPDGTRLDMGAYYFDQGPCPGFYQGDPNQDGAIDILDIVISVFCIFAGCWEWEDECLHSTMDVDEDGLITVLDVVIIVDWIMSS